MIPVDDEYTQPGAAVLRSRPVRAPERSEAGITAEVIAWIKSLPCSYAWKLHSGAMGESGHPDIDGCIAGRAVKIEMKRPGRRPTPLQMQRLIKWRATGAIAGWATSLKEAQALVEKSLAEPGWRNPLTAPGA